MNIYEYQAKQLLSKYGVSISSGVAITNYSEISQAIQNFDTSVYVVKAQIYSGGRGKAGGVKIAHNKEDAIHYAQQMYNTKLITHQTGPEGQVVRRIYVESGCDIAKEYYLSAILDRSTARIMFIVSTEGGVDIEDVADNTPGKIMKISIDPVMGLQPFHCREIAFGLDLSGEQANGINKIITSIYEAFISTDAEQIEINPLVMKNDGGWLALDAKMSFDDNALYRRPAIVKLRDTEEEDQLEKRASDHNLSYVRMDGNIGCMVNGAGLAMATMDIIKLYGGLPANFLDVGGGADTQRVTEALKIILSDQGVEGILVNIFGGIMRCDVIAEGIVEAAREVGINVPLVVRLSGTNFEHGKKILADSDLKIIAADDLGDAAEKVVKAI